MFNRKKKTRVEKAREDIERQLKVVNKQATDARKDFSKQLTQTAKELRGSVEHLFDGQEKKEAHKVAQDLERIADRVEARTAEGLAQAQESAQNNVLLTIVFAFAVGIIVGLILKVMND